MDTSSTAPKKQRSFFVTGLPYFIVAHASHHFLTALAQPMQPYIQEQFHLTNAGTAGFTSAFSLSSAAAQVPAGWLADRIGPTILITAGIVGVAIGGLFVGLSQSYVMLIIAMAFMGIMAGGYHPASTPLISVSVPTHQRGRALGLHLIGGNSSFFVAPLLAAGIIAVWGAWQGSESSAGLWRAPYIVLSVPTMVLGAFFFFFLSRRYSKAQFEQMKRRQANEAPPQPGYKRRLIAFLTMMVIGGGAGASVNAFLSLYMVNQLHTTKATAAMAMSIVFSSGVWAGPVGGWISDRIGSTKVIIVTGIIGGLMIFALKGVTHEGFALWAVLWGMGLIQAIRFPVTEVFIMSQTPAKNRSLIYGVYYSTMQYTGAIFAPVMGGFIDRFGYPTMWTFAAYAVTGVAIVTSIFIWDARG